MLVYTTASALLVRSNSGQRLHIPGCAAQTKMQDISNTGMYTTQLHHTLHVYLSLAACCTVKSPDMRCSPGGPLRVDVTTYSAQHEEPCITTDAALPTTPHMQHQQLGSIHEHTDIQWKRVVGYPRAKIHMQC